MGKTLIIKGADFSENAIIETYNIASVEADNYGYFQILNKPSTKRQSIKLLSIVDCSLLTPGYRLGEGDWMQKDFLSEHFKKTVLPTFQLTVTKAANCPFTFAVGAYKKEWVTAASSESASVIYTSNWSATTVTIDNSNVTGADFIQILFQGDNLTLETIKQYLTITLIINNG